MILSASRRTDIPSFYSDWFLRRIKEEYLYVRNPMNPHQISKIELSPKVVDCIVFWTKNPEPMLNRLEELEEYQYYFQFTLTGYGRDIECSIPHKKEVMIPVFQRLSDMIGKKRVIWRYDPILFTTKYTQAYHLKAFTQIAEALCGYTDKCVISFVDIYAKNRKSMKELGVWEPEEAELGRFAGKLAELAHKNSMTIASCAETMDLAAYGIAHNCCIDRELIEELTGCRLDVQKDKNQRSECGCVESVDIGAYNTCRNGCRYCYANHSPESVAESCRRYDPNSPLLCGVVTQEDKITGRRVKSLKEEWKEEQITFDWEGEFNERPAKQTKENPY